MTESDALRIFNLQAGCSAEEVRAAYLDLVKVWHPDRFQSDGRLTARAERELRDINEAYALLQASGSRSRLSSNGSTPGAQRQTPEPEPSFTTTPRPSDASGTRSQPSFGKSVAMGIGLGLVVTVVATAVVLMTRQPAPAAGQTTNEVPLARNPTSGSRAAGERLPPIASQSAFEGPQPESGTEILAPQRSGGGSIVVSNGSRRDAVIALGTTTGFERAVYVRAGEQITVANVASGTYRVQMMLGRGWTGNRFTRDLAYQELEQPVQFVERTQENTTEYTKLTVSLQAAVAGMRGIRQTRPFRVTK